MSFWTVILLVVGVVMVVAGSDYLVDGASDIARRSGISEFVIGLTIVGIGTSMPEMVVSFISSIRGNADMSIGNVVGSNIVNTCLILGLTALILPITITKDNFRRDIPLNIVATLLLIVLGMNKTIFNFGSSDIITRAEGLAMLLCFAAYMFYCFKKGDVSADTPQQEEAGENKPLYLSILMILLGLVGLVWGGRLFVDNASAIARHLGWSDKFIGITILAGGTSLPELATCVVAAIKKKGQLALGNIIGSNISNILLILGGAALINPLTLDKINPVDMGVMLLSALLLLVSYFTFTKHKLDRVEGAVFLLLQAGYFCYLVLSM